MIAASLLASTSRNAGGLFDSVRRLHQELERMPGMTAPVFGLEDEFTDADSEEWGGLSVISSKATGPRSFGYSPALLTNLLSGDLDILQVHGIWQYPSVVSSRWHRRTKNPYIISPHGMLDSWAVNNSHWKKQLAAFVYERSHLKKASCLRALCHSELTSIRAFGLGNACCVIPNGIDLPEDNGQQETGDEKKLLLFLGRLHPKKGLPNALRAWKQVQYSASHEWRFVVAGWDQGGHEAELKRLCDEVGLNFADVPAAEFTDNRQPTTGNGASVLFVGPAFGEHKDALLRQARAFILPSFSEGLPMSVLEAWSYGLPVLMTDHCNLPEGFAADAALRIGTDPESIAAGMEDLLRSPMCDLRRLGDNGRQLVSERFTWPQVAAQMKEVYEWVLGGGNKPECVFDES